MTSEDFHKAEFLLHCAALIDAGRETVWPLLPAGGQGRPGQQLVSVGGLKGELGERFHCVMDDAPEQILFKAEIVELETAHRRTFRFESPQGEFLGFASWVLADRDGRTGLNYDVYVRYDLPLGVAVEPLVESTRRTMDAAIDAIKAQAEAG